MSLSPSLPLHGAAAARPFWTAPILWIVLCLTLATGLSAPLPAHAQAPAPVNPAALLEEARKDMDAVRATHRDYLDEAATQELRKRALSAKAGAEAAAAALTPDLADVKARVAELGTPAEGVNESTDVAAQRTQLGRQLSTLDSQIKLARLLAVEADQAAATALAHRRLQFSERLGERSSALLSATFWTDLAAALPEDLRKLGKLGGDLRRSMEAMTAGAWLGMAAATAVLLVMLTAGKRLLLRLSATRVPSGRLRRSLHALGVLVATMLAPGLVAHVVLIGLESGEPLSAPLAKLLGGLEGVFWFAGFVAGLGTALLMPGKPSWRLPPVSDNTAMRLRWFPHLFAAALVLGWISSRLSATVNASESATWALTTLSSLTYVVILGSALLLWRRSRLEREAGEPVHDKNPGTETPHAKARAAAGAPPTEHVPLWIPVLRAGMWGVLVVSAGALLSGHVAFGAFVTQQIVWALVVLGTAYLLAVLVDDLFMTLLAPTARAPESAEKQAATEDRGPPPPRTREQSAVLLSGFSRIVIGLIGIVLLVVPYGEGPIELLSRASNLDEGLSIGEVSIKPLALLQAALVLVIGLFVVRLFKDWLTKRYMPTTRMDAGMRMSVTTLIGYVGAIVVISITMSAIGVGLERVAWVASALSVGIGFGLQAVVQNFVSGLILLAERPVKVGDWVSLAGVEGDIRRINVRATEIQMGDRSTVIVPNSEFITKIVRNVTFTDPLGMVQIKLPMPLSTDTRKARAVLLEAFQNHPGILDTPAPNVQLDAIDNGNLVFNATGFVGSPRAAYGVRSDLLFEVLDRLRDAGLGLGKPPTMLLAPAPDNTPKPDDPTRSPAPAPTPGPLTGA